MGRERRMLIWFVSTSHDSSITQYDTISEKINYVELEKYHGKKHLDLGSLNSSTFDKKHIFFARRKDLSYPDKIFCHSLFDYGDQRSHNDLEFFKRAEKEYGHFHSVEFRTQSEKHAHHRLHHLSSAYQSPFKKCFIFSHDGGGDNTVVATSTFDGKNIIDYEEDRTVNGYANLFNYIGMICKNYISRSFDVAPMHVILDFAGKVMGLSAYGHKLSRSDVEEIDFYKMLMWSRDSYKAYIGKNKNLLWDRECDNINPMKKFERGTAFQNMKRRFIWSHDNEIYHSYAIQKAAEEWTLEYLSSKKIKTQIEKNDNNLVVTGGGAFNVIINEKIKNALGYNVFVPPDPGDQNISKGLCIQYMLDHGKNVKQQTQRYLTIGLRDESNFENHVNHWKKHKSVKMIEFSEIIEILKNKKTIGVVQEHVELGPRSLGNRSILCDASFKDARQLVNKIKNREWYRPFAPVCRKQKAHEFFISENFDHSEHMSFAFKAKERTIKNFPSIVHVDGTSRLQTVTENSNPFLYKLLDHFDILLNTSFNIAGKPILNSYDEALKCLSDTPLDYVLVVKKDKLYLFEDVAI